MSEEYELKYLVVRDDLTEDDLGVAVVKHPAKFATPNNHWITFPDGTVRKQYDARSIEESEAELLFAFGALPQLKVSYRPIDEHFYNHEHLYFAIMILFFAMSMAAGMTLMVAIVIGKIDQLISVPFSYYIAAFSLYGTLASGIVYLYATGIACPRWDKLTPDDLEKNQALGALRKEKEEKARLRAPWEGVIVDTHQHHVPKKKGFRVKA